MSSTFTNKFRNLMARQLESLTDIGANSYLPLSRQSYIYVVLGRQLAWSSPSEVAPTPSIDDLSINQLYRNGIFAKLVKYQNSSLVIERNDWTSNTEYNTYEANSNFYVVNSKDQVFKCLANNSGSVSTSQPELTLSATSLEEPYVEMADGYKWKYMYTISSAQKQLFMDADWMPVTTNKFVSVAAVPGSIDIVNITNTGNNYVDGAVQDIITVTGDGTGAILKANVDNGHVVDIIIQDRGQNYTTANLTFTDVSGGTGFSAAATVSIAPIDGHGHDAADELLASTVMFNVDFDGMESGAFPADNDFRQIYAISNPYEYGTTTLASDDSYTLYTKIKTSPGLGDFNNDEKVYQGASFSEATYSADVISFDEINNQLYVNNVQGTLSTNQSVKGLNSGSIRVAVSTIEPSLDLFSGKVLYISNRLPVSRDTDQNDRIRFIISF